MKQPQVIHLPFFNQNPTNPAKVYLDKGLIYLNDLAMIGRTDFEKKFILEHEKGHYFNQSNSEFDADIYALQKLAFSEKNSLKKSIKAVENLAIYQPERVNNVTLAALELLAQKGNVEARALLGSYRNALGEQQAANKITWTLFFLSVITFLIILKICVTKQ